MARRGGVIPKYRDSERNRPRRHRHAETPRAAPAFPRINGECAITDRGFTLIELVMILVIIGILAIYAVSRLDFQSTFSERGFHDKLKAGLQFARKAAVAQRRYVCVTVNAAFVEFKFNPNEPETVTLPVSCANDLSLPAADGGCGGAANRICAPSGVSITGTNFWFDAGGGSSAGVTFTSTGQPSITLENETGYVH